MWMRKLLLLVLLVLVGILVIPQGVLADTGTAALTGTVPLSMSFSVSGSAAMASLVPSTTVYNTTAGNVNATAVTNGPWQVTAYDALDAGSGGAPNKPAGTEGLMSEYVTATNVYVAAGKHLTNKLTISGDGGSTYKNINAVGTAQTIATGDTNTPDGTPVIAIFKQVVAANEEAVKAANQYHIIVTFEATQN